MFLRGIPTSFLLLLVSCASLQMRPPFHAASTDTSHPTQAGQDTSKLAQICWKSPVHGTGGRSPPHIAPVHLPVCPSQRKSMRLAPAPEYFGCPASNSGLKKGLGAAGLHSGQLKLSPRTGANPPQAERVQGMVPKTPPEWWDAPRAWNGRERMVSAHGPSHHCPPPKSLPASPPTL